MADYTKGLKEIAYVMRFEGKKCKEVAKELKVSLDTLTRWMKDYDAKKV